MWLKFEFRDEGKKMTFWKIKSVGQTAQMWNLNPVSCEIIKLSDICTIYVTDYENYL